MAFRFDLKVILVAGSLQQITNFSPNPSNAGMFVYKPTKLASPPPVLVAIHYYGGSAQAYYSGTQYATLADQYGYIVIYPNVPANQGGCWDVASNATLTHNGGSDSLGIVSMAKYAVSTWGGDVNRVFVTGTSSGAMMTNVLIGAYPDVFQGGAAFSGVPYGCFAGPSSWNSQCSQGQLIKTAQQWVCGLFESDLNSRGDYRVTWSELLIQDTRGHVPRCKSGMEQRKYFYCKG